MERKRKREDEDGIMLQQKVCKNALTWYVTHTIGVDLLYEIHILAHIPHTAILGVNVHYNMSGYSVHKKAEPI